MAPRVTVILSLPSRMTCNSIFESGQRHTRQPLRPLGCHYVHASISQTTISWRIPLGVKQTESRFQGQCAKRKCGTFGTELRQLSSFCRTQRSISARDARAVREEREFERNTYFIWERIVMNSRLLIADSDPSLCETYDRYFSARVSMLKLHWMDW